MNASFCFPVIGVAAAVVSALAVDAAGVEPGSCQKSWISGGIGGSELEAAGGKWVPVGWPLDRGGAGFIHQNKTLLTAWTANAMTANSSGARKLADLMDIR